MRLPPVTLCWRHVSSSRSAVNQHRCLRLPGAFGLATLPISALASQATGLPLALIPPACAARDIGKLLAEPSLEFDRRLVEQTGRDDAPLLLVLGRQTLDERREHMYTPRVERRPTVDGGDGWIDRMRATIS